MNLDQITAYIEDPSLLDASTLPVLKDLAEKHPFDVFITADKNLPYQ